MIRVEKMKYTVKEAKTITNKIPQIMPIVRYSVDTVCKPDVSWFIETDIIVPAGRPRMVSSRLMVWSCSLLTKVAATSKFEATILTVTIEAAERRSAVQPSINTLSALVPAAAANASTNSSFVLAVAADANTGIEKTKETKTTGTQSIDELLPGAENMFNGQTAAAAEPPAQKCPAEQRLQFSMLGCNSYPGGQPSSSQTP